MIMITVSLMKMPIIIIINIIWASLKTFNWNIIWFSIQLPIGMDHLHLKLPIRTDHLHLKLPIGTDHLHVWFSERCQVYWAWGWLCFKSLWVKWNKEKGWFFFVILILKEVVNKSWRGGGDGWIEWKWGKHTWWEWYSDIVRQQTWDRDNKIWSIGEKYQMLGESTKWKLWEVEEREDGFEDWQKELVWNKKN